MGFEGKYKIMREIEKDPNGNHRAKKYNVIYEKFTGLD